MSRPVAAVVLAAGVASRFSGTKLLQPVHGRPLLLITTDKLIGLVDDIVVVLGHDADRIGLALDEAPVRTVINEAYEEGLSTSVKSGVAALDAGVAGALIVLGDQPIPPEVIEELVKAYRATGGPIVAPVYDGSLGNPVLFDRALFSQLQQLAGDRGARSLIDEHWEKVVRVDFPIAPPIDVDTLGDYGEFLRGWVR